MSVEVIQTSLQCIDVVLREAHGRRNSKPIRQDRLAKSRPTAALVLCIPSATPGNPAWIAEATRGDNAASRALFAAH
ncbi:hypothetical protein [Geodermatophilus tzadiensis]|uniref:hypothetical protein n=1 Tax=Geodermatophilus tzadiensis TaxID=1137988 RepID=UPI0011B29F50|nr:hypothetical protein [Geodermatophilus tzadiensis]